jgi:hypothetical protein
MRESRTYGSVRGARGNPRPYRYPTGRRVSAARWAQSGNECGGGARISQVFHPGYARCPPATPPAPW